MPTFLKTIDGTKAVLENHIANNVIFAGLNIGAVRTDNGGDFESFFHRKLDVLGVSRHLCQQTSNSKMASLRGRYQFCETGDGHDQREVLSGVVK